MYASELGYTTLDLTNNVVAGSQTSSGAPGIYTSAAWGSNIVLRHTTLMGNTGDGSALFAYTAWQSSIAVINTIIEPHTVGMNGAGWVSLEATLWDSVGTYIISSLASTDAISITGRARFVDDVYHIAADSDAVDQSMDVGVTVDMGSDPRPSSSGFDIGTDEVTFLMGLAPAERRAWAEAGQTVVFTHTLRNTGAQPVLIRLQFPLSQSL